MRPSKDIDTIKHRTRIGRILMGVVLLLLSIQLMGATSHKHALADTKSDCAACDFVHHQPAGLPPIIVEALPATVLVAYRPVGPGLYRFVSRPSHLIPQPQAPPRHHPTL